MNLTKTTEALEKFGKYVVQQSKSILTKQKKGGGSLYNSIKQELDEEQNAFLLDFMMESYGEFVDKGVKGKNPNALPRNAKWYGIQKGKNSPYKFGSMKSRGLRKAINKWTVTKNIKGIRDKKTGRFLPRKTTQFLITRSIYLAGITPSMFFTKPFEKAFKNLPTEVINAFALDVEKSIVLGIKK
tara:strand:+ start:2585 stop:3139 length:555 start_codon:yes stop_codon:yes gene_type:complete